MLRRKTVELLEGPGPVRLYKEFVPDVKAIEGAPAQFRFTITTNQVDRDLDVIDPAGWDLDSYLRNPVVLWAHDYHQPPIAVARSMERTETGLASVAEFVDPAVYPFAGTIAAMVRMGALRATSVGFRPVAWEKNAARGGVDFAKQELLEYSIVPVPANPGCLVEARAAGVDVEPLREWAEETLARLGSAPATLAARVADEVERRLGDGRKSFRVDGLKKPRPGGCPRDDKDCPNYDEGSHDQHHGFAALDAVKAAAGVVKANTPWQCASFCRMCADAVAATGTACVSCRDACRTACLTCASACEMCDGAPDEAACADACRACVDAALACVEACAGGDCDASCEACDAAVAACRGCLDACGRPEPSEEPPAAPEGPATVMTMAVKGVAPADASTSKADVGEAWSAPTLADFTSDDWGALSATERRHIAGHYAWSAAMPPEKFGDLKLPHHRASDGAVVWRGVAAATARLGQSGVPDGDLSAVKAHLARHYRAFDKTPPWDAQSSAEPDETKTAGGAAPPGGGGDPAEGPAPVPAPPPVTKNDDFDLSDVEADELEGVTTADVLAAVKAVVVTDVADGIGRAVRAARGRVD